MAHSLKDEATMRPYNYKSAGLDKMQRKDPPLLPVYSFWTFILLTALLLFAIALLNRAF